MILLIRDMLEIEKGLFELINFWLLYTSSYEIICRLLNKVILERPLSKFANLVHFYAYKLNVAPVAPVVCRLAKV